MNERLWDHSLVITAILVALITSVSIWITLGAAPDLISRFTFSSFALALGAALASYALRTFRFYYFLRRSGILVSFPRAVMIQVVGFALAVTPGRIGEVFKLRLIREHAGTPVVRSAPLLLLDRLTEGGGFMILAIASALMIPTLEDDIPTPWLLLLGLGAMTVFLLTRRLWARGAWVANTRLAESRLGERFLPPLRDFWRGLNSTFTAKQIAGGLGLSVVARFADGLVVYFIAQMLGAKLVLPAAVFVLAASGLVGGASFMPAGIGVVETTMTGLLLLIGLTLPNAIAVTLFTRLGILWLWVILGLLLALLMRWILLREKLSVDPEP